MTGIYDPEKYWQERLERHFNLSGVGHLSFSEAYNEWLYRRKNHALGQILGDTDLRGARVLDVGSGTGFFVRFYASRGASVHGIDITAVSVERLSREFPAFTFTRGDVASDAFDRPPARFDVINVWDVLYHVIDDASFARALRNIAAAGRPGTRLILTDALGAAEPIVAGPHVTLRPLASYQRHLPALGFELQSLTPLYFYLNDVKQPDGEALAPTYFARDEALQLISSTNLSVGCWVMAPGRARG
jgi:SAM-dependent methyltransferase